MAQPQFDKDKMKKALDMIDAPAQDASEDTTTNMRDSRSDALDAPARQDRSFEQLDEQALRSKARQLSREFDQNFLALAPKIEGYHVVWATTVSQVSMQFYEKRGYVPVLKSEVPGWDRNVDSSTTGQYANYITCNEMLAMKLPEVMYQEYMLIDHHERPLNKESSNRDKIRALKDQSEGRIIEEGDLGEPRRKPRPLFS